MKIRKLMKQRRKAILERWLSQILNTYPSDAAKFMAQNPNRFSNPVGQTYAREFETIFDALIDNSVSDELDQSLEKINKIRAVQDFTPSRAVAYIFFLKTAIREEAGIDVSDKKTAEELLSIESQIDGLALKAFDSYMRCREKLFEVKCRDIKRRATLFGGPDNEKSKNRS